MKIIVSRITSFGWITRCNSRSVRLRSARGRFAFHRNFRNIFVNLN